MNKLPIRRSLYYFGLINRLQPQIQKCSIKLNGNVESTTSIFVFKNVQHNHFSIDVTSSVNEKVDKVVNKLVDIYLEDKEKLITSSFLTPKSLGQMEHLINQVISYCEEKQELENFSKEDSSEELKKIAEEDLDKLNKKMTSLKEQIFDCLLELHEGSDEDEIILEVSAGVGGQEAMLFAQDLLNMYQNFCLLNGWQVDLHTCETTDLGGIRNACLGVSGIGCYSKLKYEGGIHRVQRIPKTEKAGRVHTSTASVAVLPQPSEISINIDNKDLKIETMRASGAGGQHVNKTDSAVRITHLPTGFTVECQSSRSQDRNKKEALKKLRAKLYQQVLDEQEAKFSSQKKLQVGTKARSEKIRTYNFPQDRITDHRVGLTVHNVNGVLEGGSSLHNLIQEVVEEGKKERLVELLYL